MLIRSGTGWIPDPKNPKDFHRDSPQIKPHLESLFAVKKGKELVLPASMNLEGGFPPVYDQGQTNSCTANAIAGLVDYYEKKTQGDFIEPSRLFIYKTTRNILKSDSADAGAYLRTAMEALTLFGAPPESYWPFQPELVSIEPSAFLYSFAQSYRAVRYYRYDPDGLNKSEVLKHLKASLAAGLPCACGFFLFESMASAQKSGNIPFPGPSEKGTGGHAVVAVGYDDAHVITNPGDQQSTTGAFRIRNSWGASWGDQGYGWLPYEYVLRELAIDWWSLLKEDWFDLNKPVFKISNSGAIS